MQWALSIQIKWAAIVVCELAIHGFLGFSIHTRVLRTLLSLAAIITRKTTQGVWVTIKRFNLKLPFDSTDDEGDILRAFGSARER